MKRFALLSALVLALSASCLPSCLRIREETDWSKVTHLANPPADGWDTRYDLISILSNTSTPKDAE